MSTLSKTPQCSTILHLRRRVDPVRVARCPLDGGPISSTALPSRGRAIAPALAFTAWPSLTRQAELGDGEAVELMPAAVAAADRVHRASA